MKSELIGSFDHTPVIILLLLAYHLFNENVKTFIYLFLLIYYCILTIYNTTLNFVTIIKDPLTNDQLDYQHKKKASVALESALKGILDG